MQVSCARIVVLAICLCWWYRKIVAKLWSTLLRWHKQFFGDWWVILTRTIILFLRSLNLTLLTVYDKRLLRVKELIHILALEDFWQVQSLHVIQEWRPYLGNCILSPNFTVDHILCHLVSIRINIWIELFYFNYKKFTII